MPLGMLERIRAKERTVRESKRRISLELQKSERESESETLQGLVDALVSVYAVRGVGALYEDELLSHLPSKQTGEVSSNS